MLFYTQLFQWFEVYSELLKNCPNMRSVRFGQTTARRDSVATICKLPKLQKISFVTYEYEATDEAIENLHHLQIANFR